VIYHSQQNKQLTREDLDLVNEVREQAHMKEVARKQQVFQQYNLKVNLRRFKEGEMVLWQVGIDLRNAKNVKTCCCLGEALLDSLGYMIRSIHFRNSKGRRIVKDFQCHGPKEILQIKCNFLERLKECNVRDTFFPLAGFILKEGFFAKGFNEAHSFLNEMPILGSDI